MGDYRKLEVWRKAHALSMRVDEIALGIRSARYKTLRNQMERSAGSIPSNIVEGSGQESPKEFRRFLRIALNSANETDYHLLKARDSHLINRRQYDQLSAQISEVARMLVGLQRYLNTLEKPPEPKKPHPPRRPTNNQ
jgi:four helix bundle protein